MASITSASCSRSRLSSSESAAVEQQRKKRSLVWEYFIYDQVDGKSICQVEGIGLDSGVCNKLISGKNPTNLKQHLKSCHQSVYQQLCHEEEQAKQHKQKLETEKKAKSKKYLYQATLKETLVKHKKYTADDPHCSNITKKLAIFVGCSNVANSLVENLEFKDFVQSLDPRYSMPGRNALNKEIEKVFIELKAEMSVFVQAANKVSITCEKGLTSSYLGVTGHFYSRKDNRRHTMTLAVRRLIGSHTAAHIREVCEEVLKEWDIDLGKVSAILTDNCSNIVAAFKKQVSESEDVHVEDPIGELEDIEECESLDSEDETVNVLDEELEFLKFEDKHNAEFVSFNRISCFSHTLQLAVNKFNGVSQYKDLLKRTHVIVRKVNSSTKATERLVSLSAKKLVKDCPVRWSSTYLLIQRLVEVRDHLKVVLEEQSWDGLVTSEWRTLTRIVELLEPFARYTQLLSADESTTLSCIVPALMDLNIHLEELKRVPEVAEAAKLLQSEVSRRFIKYTAPGVESYNPIMCTATALDLRYNLCLNKVQIDSAKEFLETQIKEAESSSSGDASPIRPETCEISDPPPEKRFKHLLPVLEQRSHDVSNKPSKWKAELDHFFSSNSRLHENEDPLDFWIKNESTYPLLSNIAVDILCIPSSSAHIERTFSTAGESSSGRRNRLTSHNLEREVILRKNKHYL